MAGLERVIGIAAFEYTGAALRDDGTVWMWGRDREGLLATGALTLSGQSGKPYFTPRRVAGLDGAMQIAGGSKHVLALKSDGTVWVWGANRYFQLGLGDTDWRGVPTTISSLTGVTRVYAHADMSAARLADGSWLVWETRRWPNRPPMTGRRSAPRRRFPACCVPPATWRSGWSGFVTAPSAPGSNSLGRSGRAAASMRSRRAACS